MRKHQKNKNERKNKKKEMRKRTKASPNYENAQRDCENENRRNEETLTDWKEMTLSITGWRWKKK